MLRRNRGFAYNQTSIAKNAPSASGVYVIFREGLWIYIGETDDIRGRLLTHIDGDDRRIARYLPTALWKPGSDHLKLCAEKAGVRPLCPRLFLYGTPHALTNAP